MRLTLTFKRAAILKSRKRTWPIEAEASSVPFKTSACSVLMIKWAKTENHSRSWLEAIQWVLVRSANRSSFYPSEQTHLAVGAVLLMPGSRTRLFDLDPPGPTFAGRRDVGLPKTSIRGS